VQVKIAIFNALILLVQTYALKEGFEKKNRPGVLLNVSIFGSDEKKNRHLRLNVTVSGVLISRVVLSAQRYKN